MVHREDCIYYFVCSLWGSKCDCDNCEKFKGKESDGNKMEEGR